MPVRCRPGASSGRARTPPEARPSHSLPVAALIGGATYALTRRFGTGAAGPLLVAVLMLGAAAAVFARCHQAAVALASATSRSISSSLVHAPTDART